MNEHTQAKARAAALREAEAQTAYLRVFRRRAALDGVVATAVAMTVETLAELTELVGTIVKKPTDVAMLLRVAYTAGLAVGVHYPEYALHIVNDGGGPEQARVTADHIVALHPLEVGLRDGTPQ